MIEFLNIGDNGFWIGVITAAVIIGAIELRKLM